MNTESRSEANTFRAQNGEDLWLDAFFGGRSHGFFVDVGAYDGVNLSNSYHFEQLGWTGVLVEPDPRKADQCRGSRPRSLVFQCAAVGSPEMSEITFFQVEAGEVYSTTKLTDSHAARISGMGLQPTALTVPARTLDSMLEEAGTSSVDFVSIDVEGAEMEVLRGFDIERWKPAVVIIESNTKIRSADIRNYFVSHGYAYRDSIDVNDFYVRRAGSSIPAAVADAIYYARHRVKRRFARIAHNLRRAWKKWRGEKAMPH
jgi:FkbM family methyltransferase